MRGYRMILLMVAVIGVSVFLLPACREEARPAPSQTSHSDGASYDIVVIGSELEGVYLAKAAAEEGSSVVIIDPRSEPGGQLIQGEMTYLDEPQDESGASLLQGEVKKLFTGYKSGQIRKSSEFRTYYQSLLSGLPLESGIQLGEIQMESDGPGRRIRSVSYTTKDGVKRTVEAKYFVENTDFAALTAKLNVARIPGIERVYGGDRDHMAATMMMKFRNVDWAQFKNGVQGMPVKDREDKFGSNTTVTDTFTWGFGNVGGSYKPGSKQAFLRGLNIINQRDGDAAINALLLFQVDPSNEQSIRQAMELGRRETALILEHLRKQLPGWEQAELNGYPSYLYIRDYDRYETEYILQASDLMSGKMFWDNVSVAGYPIDLQGTENHQWGARKGDPDKYGIPLRSFVVKGYTNALVAGKNVGATGAAYGSARIQPNTALAGEVMGTILGRIKGKYGLTEIDVAKMTDLQQYIRKEKGIQLQGADGKNKISGYSQEQIERLNNGDLLVK